jgi:hypothetical protein
MESLDDFTYISTYSHLYNYNITSRFQDGDLPWANPDSAQKKLFETTSRVASDRVAEDRLIIQILHEILLKKTYDQGVDAIRKAQHAGLMKPQNGEIIQPVRDGIEQGLRLILTARKVSLEAVFAARLLLDINNILGNEASSAWEQLRRRGAQISKALNFTCLDDRGKCLNTTPEEPRYCNQEVSEWASEDMIWEARLLSSTVKSVTTHTRLVATKGHLLPNLTKPPLSTLLANPYAILPATDLCFLFKSNPVYCGLETLRLALKMDEVGTMFTNHFCHFIGVAHIYNAAKQNGLIHGKWEDLEVATNAHIGPLFKGSLPTTFQQIIQRLCFVMKVPASDFASNSRKPLKINYEKLSYNYTLLERAELSTKISAYFEEQLTAEQLLSFTNATINSRTSQHARRNLKPTNVQTLEELLNAVSSTIPKLNLDLVTLSRKCEKLLVLIRAALKTRLEFQNMKDGKELGNVYHKQALKTAGDIIMRTLVSNDRLHIAGEVIQSFLEEANSVVTVEPVEVVYTELEPNLAFRRNTARNHEQFKKIMDEAFRNFD